MELHTITTHNPSPPSLENNRHAGKAARIDGLPTLHPDFCERILRTRVDSSSSRIRVSPFRGGIANPQLIEKETENIGVLLDSLVEGGTDPVPRTRSGAKQDGMI